MGFQVTGVLSVGFVFEQLANNLNWAETPYSLKIYVNSGLTWIADYVMEIELKSMYLEIYLLKVYGQMHFIAIVYKRKWGQLY